MQGLFSHELTNAPCHMIGNAPATLINNAPVGDGNAPGLTLCSYYMGGNPVAGVRHQIALSIADKYKARGERIIQLTMEREMFAKINIDKDGALRINWSAYRQENPCREVFWYEQNAAIGLFRRRNVPVNLCFNFTDQEAWAELIKNQTMLSLVEGTIRIVYFSDKSRGPTPYWHEALLWQNACEYKMRILLPLGYPLPDHSVKAWQEQNRMILTYILVGADLTDTATVRIEGYHVYTVDDLPDESGYLLCLGRFPNAASKSIPVSIGNTEELHCLLESTAHLENLAKGDFCFMWIAYCHEPRDTIR